MQIFSFKRQKFLQIRFVQASSGFRFFKNFMQNMQISIAFSKGVLANRGSKS